MWACPLLVDRQIQTVWINNFLGNCKILHTDRVLLNCRQHEKLDFCCGDQTTAVSESESMREIDSSDHTRVTTVEGMKSLPDFLSRIPRDQTTDPQRCETSGKTTRPAGLLTDRS